MAWACGNSSVMVRSIWARHARRRDGREPLGGAAGQHQGRLARGQVDDAEVAPEHAARRSRCRAPSSRPPWRRSAWRSSRRGWRGGRTCVCSISVKTRSTKRSPKRSSVRSMRRMSMMSLPMPRIMRCRRQACAAGLGARLVHQRAHAADGAVEAAEDRLADQEMADIELDDRRDRGDRPDRVEGEAVAGMAFEAERLGMRRRRRRCGRAGAARSRALGLAIGAGVQLDDVRRRPPARHRAGADRAR